MKYVMLVCDGMSDRPVRELGGKTPLESSRHPFMDKIAGEGVCGLVRTLYEGFPLDSGVANMSLLGYGAEDYPGRAPLEAENMNVNLGEGDVAYRCNLVTEAGGVLKDFTAGHIPNRQAHELMNFLNTEFANHSIRFYPGVSYRHLLVLRDRFSADVVCQPPHDIVGEHVADKLPVGETETEKDTAAELNRLMEDSRNLLAGHPINRARVEEGENPANRIWLWGGGQKPNMEKFSSRHGLDGALISAVDLLKGIARHIGMQVIEVPGATGYLDTNYEGKAEHALKALEENDFVYIHVESTDESGHEGSSENKIKAIEDIDSRLLKILVEELEEPYSITVTSDHATPVEVKTHVTDLVPYAICKSGVTPDDVDGYAEKKIIEYGGVPEMQGRDLLDYAKNLK